MAAMVAMTVARGIFCQNWSNSLQYMHICFSHTVLYWIWDICQTLKIQNIKMASILNLTSVIWKKKWWCTTTSLDAVYICELALHFATLYSWIKGGMQNKRLVKFADLTVLWLTMARVWDVCADRWSEVLSVFPEVLLPPESLAIVDL